MPCGTSTCHQACDIGWLNLDKDFHYSYVLQICVPPLLLIIAMPFLIVYARSNLLLNPLCDAACIIHKICTHSAVVLLMINSSLRWRHNGCDGVSNHQPHDCLLNRLFRRRSKKTSELRVTDLCVGNLPGTGGWFPAQIASNAENVSIWWRHHDNTWNMHGLCSGLAND